MNAWVKYISFFLINIFVVVTDQLTKVIVERALPLNHFIVVIPNFFDIRSIRNPGSAFGIMARLSDSARLPFLIGVSLIAMILLLYLFYKAQKERPLYPISLSLVFAGAFGNLIDRILFGEVRDFIHLHIYNLSWPVFNIADSAITVGIALLAWELLVVEPRLEAKKGKKD